MPPLFFYLYLRQGEYERNWQNETASSEGSSQPLIGRASADIDHLVGDTAAGVSRRHGATDVYKNAGAGVTL